MKGFGSLLRKFFPANPQEVENAWTRPYGVVEDPYPLAPKTPWRGWARGNDPSIDNLSQMSKQDRPTAAEGRFDRRNPFKRGMDVAAKQDNIVGKYKASQAQVGDPNPPENWTQMDFDDAGNVYMDGERMVQTTAKQDRVASKTKRAKPTKSDVLYYKRASGVGQGGYPTAETQRTQELQRHKALASAKDFEKGLELAKMMKGLKEKHGK